LTQGLLFQFLLRTGRTDAGIRHEYLTYGGVYATWDGKDNGRIVRAGIALDFSKYLVERSGQKLQLFYYVRNKGYDSQWGATTNNYLIIDHVFGTVFRTSW
jgi:hypothetical protein